MRWDKDIAAKVLLFALIYGAVSSGVDYYVDGSVNLWAKMIAILAASLALYGFLLLRPKRSD